MDASKPLNPPQEATDIFSLSDQVLSDKLEFIEEIGFGNWGSVWLCRPKTDNASPDARIIPEQKIAVKLVHRSKTPTTAARVRSLWNEMKIVRTFKSDPHPSIIPFHSFIITPSYALITMAYLPTLVPVEVDETKAREWFRFLLSGVEFLHKRGVVHNDIKPANILLSTKNIPVLVDFGFAEKYDLNSTTAFHSNLSYGTPEYLSPERARGLPHDTRKSDVWSLGITFFEILIGRTPFEHSEGEQFATKEDLEKYWARTLRGKWVGSWKMSKEMERLLRRMISPNADLRCTASEAMVDPCWNALKQSAALHKRSSSYTSSIIFEKDWSKLMPTPPRPTKEHPTTPPGLEPLKPLSEKKRIHSLTRARSQPKVATASVSVQPRKRGAVQRTAELSPIKGSTPPSPFTAGGKENSMTAKPASAARKPLGAITMRENLPRPKLEKKPSADHRKARVLADLTRNANIEDLLESGKKETNGQRKSKDRVKERVKEWEREKERLREMARLEELEKERDDQLQSKHEDMVSWQKKMESTRQKQQTENKENRASAVFSASISGSDNARTSNSFAANESSISVFKHSIKKSIDKTMKFYKTSGITGKNPSAQDLQTDSNDNDAEKDGRESWEDGFLRDVKSSLPAVQQAARNERVAADARMDRMTIWIQNVEKVIADARQTFASSANHLAPLPPLPLPPSRSASNSRANRSSRLPRKVLTASQIFADDFDCSMGNVTTQSGASVAETSYPPVNASSLAKRNNQLIPEIHTPSRQRRATVSTHSPEPIKKTTDGLQGLDAEAGTPSKRREKSKSHGNLYQLHIAPISYLEAELNKPKPPPASPRLSQVVDSSLFIAPIPSPHEEQLDVPDISIVQEPSYSELTSSPLHVEPYPPRKPAATDADILDSPSQRRLENVYDRFLMATSGVKRVGKGYQSDNHGPVLNTTDSNAHKRNTHRAFYSARKPMPPPVSSEDQNRVVAVDEMGVITYSNGDGMETPHTVLKDESNTTVSLVRRALKAIVPGKTASKRLSRIA